MTHHMLSGCYKKRGVSRREEEWKSWMVQLTRTGNVEQKARGGMGRFIYEEDRQEGASRKGRMVTKEDIYDKQDGGGGWQQKEQVP